MDSSRKTSVYFILAILILLGSILFNIIVFVQYGEHYLNADISSQLVLGKNNIEENKFLSKNFYYSTEVEVLNSAHIYQMMLLLFPDNWHLARLGAVIVNMFILGAGFIYMARAFTMDAPWIIITLSAILLPFSIGYMFNMTFGCFYQVFTATVFFDIGSILRFLNKRKKALYLSLLVIVNFIISLSGIRMIMFSAMPIAVTCFYFLICAATKINRLSDVKKLPEWKIVFGGLINGLSIVLGYIVNKKIIVPNYFVDEYISTVLRQFSISDVLIHIQYIFEYLGFVGEIPLFSLSGIFSIVTIILFLLLVISLLSLFRESIRTDFTFKNKIISYKDDIDNQVEEFSKKQRETVSLTERFIIVFCISSIFLGILINVSSPKGRVVGNLGVSYYMPGFVLLIVTAFMYLTKISCVRRWVNYIFVIVLYLVFAGKSVVTVRDNMYSSDSHYEQTADWLVENGYTEGFATFWNGNVLSEASDGRIEVWVLWDLENSQIYKWLQKTSHSSIYPEGKCFVYATSMQVFEKKVNTEFMESIAERSIILPNDDRLYLFNSGKEYMSNFAQ